MRRLGLHAPAARRAPAAARARGRTASPHMHAHPYRHRGCAGPGKWVQSYLVHILFLPFREIAGGGLC